MRVGFDTKVLVRAVATHGLCADIFNLILAEHQLIVGETVLSEIRRVLKQKMRVPGVTIGEFAALLRTEALVVPRAKTLSIVVRDKSDMLVLGESIAGDAEVLLAGDTNFLEMARPVPLDMLTPRDFWERLRADTSVKN